MVFSSQWMSWVSHYQSAQGFGGGSAVHDGGVDSVLSYESSCFKLPFTRTCWNNLLID
jgi:hypothetical protein